MKKEELEKILNELKKKFPRRVSESGDLFFSIHPMGNIVTLRKGHVLLQESSESTIIFTSNENGVGQEKIFRLEIGAGDKIGSISIRKDDTEDSGAKWSENILV